MNARTPLHTQQAFLCLGSGDGWIISSGESAKVIPPGQKQRWKWKHIHFPVLLLLMPDLQQRADWPLCISGNGDRGGRGVIWLHVRLEAFLDSGLVIRVVTSTATQSKLIIQRTPAKATRKWKGWHHKIEPSTHTSHTHTLTHDWCLLPQ